MSVRAARGGRPPRWPAWALAALLLLAACPGGGPPLLLPGPEPGVPARLALVVAPRASETQNVAWQAFSVRVEDAYGALVPYATNPIQVVLSKGSGTLSGMTQVAASAGVAAFSNVIFDGTGAISVDLVSSNLAGVRGIGLNIAPCVATVPVQLVYATPPVASVEQEALWTAFSVQVQDCEGTNLAVDGEPTQAELFSGTGSFGGTPLRMSASGVATFNDLTFDTTDLITVQVTSSNGLRAAYGPVVSVTPKQVANLQVVAADGYLTLTWDEVLGAQNYNVYWDTAAGVTPAAREVVAAAQTPFQHTGLVNGVEIFYVVTAESAAGEGPASGEDSGTPADGPGSMDPLFSSQWHLENTGQGGATPGEDVNVTPVWDSMSNTTRGEGIRVAVVDDGLEIGHEDLFANVAAGKSYNYIDDSSDPTSGWHGTCVAGIIGARDLNDSGGRGVAPRVNLVGYNFIEANTLSALLDATSRGSPDVFLANNSWGPPDGNGTLGSSPSLWRDAVENELVSGRGGLGTIFLFAAGNGSRCSPAAGASCTGTDNSNYDGYANYRDVIAVCAVGDDGVRAFYSERGANLLVCGPSEGASGQAITTTDRSGGPGLNASGAPDLTDPDYTKTFNGTSAATPMVAGVVALVLQANPSLGWRDVREILALSARKNHPGQGDWTTNGSGLPINHNYGFGVADAAAAVTLAAGWTPIAAPRILATKTAAPNLPIPDNNATGVTNGVLVSASDITSIEAVEVVFSAANHVRSGDLKVVLSSPDGTESVLADAHDCFEPCSRYDAWTFSSTRHLRESADGTWTLRVSDLRPWYGGTFQSWTLRIYGR